MERRDPVQRLTPEELRWDRGSVRAPGVFRTRTMTRTCTCPEKSTRGGGPVFSGGDVKSGRPFVVFGKTVRGICIIQKQKSGRPFPRAPLLGGGGGGMFKVRVRFRGPAEGRVPGLHSIRRPAAAPRDRRAGRGPRPSLSGGRSSPQRRPLGPPATFSSIPVRPLPAAPCPPH